MSGSQRSPNDASNILDKEIVGPSSGAAIYHAFAVMICA